MEINEQQLTGSTDTIAPIPAWTSSSSLPRYATRNTWARTASIGAVALLQTSCPSSVSLSCSWGSAGCTYIRLLSFP